MNHHAARRHPVRAAIAAVAVLSLGAATAGCGDDADEGIERTTVEEGDPSLEDDDPRPVTRSGEVRQVISSDAFLLGGEGGEQPVLVVAAEPDDAISEGATVRVTGVLHTAFDLPAVEDELGRGLDDEDLAGHEEAPYIVADEVEPVS